MNFFIKTALAGAACSLVLQRPAAALELNGVQLDETTTVAGTPLRLNGAGVGTRAWFKVYVVGLYLNEHKRTAADVFATEGPRRVTISLLRDVPAEDFGQAITAVLNANTDRLEKTRLAAQTTQLSNVIAKLPTGLKKADRLTLDWVPGTGTVITLNQRSLTVPIQDIAFYNALLKIWLGERPADALLKTQLLGETPDRLATL
jgi:hypothetical protein